MKKILAFCTFREQVYINWHPNVGNDDPPRIGSIWILGDSNNELRWGKIGKAQKNALTDGPDGSEDPPYLWRLIQTQFEEDVSEGRLVALGINP